MRGKMEHWNWTSLALKAIIYRIMSFAFSSIILMMLTGNMGKALCFSITLESAKTIIYFAYDWVWGKFVTRSGKWGIKKGKKDASYG